MHNEFKSGQKVMVYGPGENDNKFYRNISAIVIERDPYYKDYHVRFKDGTTDWVLPEHIRKLYLRKKKRSR